MTSALVVIPTYNEAQSIGNVIERILAVAIPTYDLEILVVDDNSPDGTGAIVAALADERLHLLARERKAGLGAAYLAGFAWALARDYEVIIEMDGDGSHLPEQLPRLFAAHGAGADLVIGARWIPGGKVDNWSKARQLLSRSGNAYARLALGFGLHDATAGYRLFRRRTLDGLELSTVDSNGYCFQIDLAWRARQHGFQIAEVPITFVERTTGVSKMSRGIVVEAIWQITKWGFRRLR